MSRRSISLIGYSFMWSIMWSVRHVIKVSYCSHSARNSFTLKFVLKSFLKCRSEKFDEDKFVKFKSRLDSNFCSGCNLSIHKLLLCWRVFVIILIGNKEMHLKQSWSVSWQLWLIYWTITGNVTPPFLLQKSFSNHFTETLHIWDAEISLIVINNMFTQVLNHEWSFMFFQVSQLSLNHWKLQFILKKPHIWATTTN